MKVYLGPYEKEIIPLGKWSNPVLRFFLTRHKKRKTKVHIDDYDVWGLDETLAFIIVPALQRLKEKKQGSPHVDDDEVPEHLKSTNDLPKDNEWDIGHNHHARWDYVIDEMIWAFQQDTFDDEAMFHENIDNIGMCMEGGSIKFFTPEGKAPHHFDMEGYKTHYQRKLKGRMLFAKYYNNLWD